MFVFPTKGFSSWSMFVIDIRTLVNIFGKDQELVVLLLSDLDPSGQYIGKDYVNKFDYMVEELGFKTPAVIKRIALTKEQVQEFNLPPRHKKYKKKGVLQIWELDALPPKVLRSILKEAVEEYINLEQFFRDLKEEQAEKKELLTWIEEG